MMGAQVMIDLETMGQGHDASITQIGAVVFFPESGEVGAEFSADVTLVSSVRAGLCMDASAVLWWIEQGPEARGALLAGQAKARPLLEVLKDFRAWIGHLKPEGVWSHGSTFDLPILSNAYRTNDLNPGWSFRAARDTRTLFWLCGEFDPWVEVAPTAEVRHVAVDDARRQARAVMRAIQRVLAFQRPLASGEPAAGPTAPSEEK